MFYLINIRLEPVLHYHFPTSPKMSYIVLYYTLLYCTVLYTAAGIVRIIRERSKVRGPPGSTPTIELQLCVSGCDR